MNEGINFIVDGKGRKVGVQLDLARYGELWKRCQEKIRAGPSVRLRGISARVAEQRIGGIVMKLRRLLGPNYRIIIEKDRICLEGSMRNNAFRKKIDRILADETCRSINRGMNDIRPGRVITEKEFLKKHPELK